MEFLILGPVEAQDADGPVVLGPPKQRAVLAELLVRANHAVPREELIAALWGDSPPKTAVTTLQVYVHGLRRALGHDRIETVGNAYRARVADDELDLERFRRLLGKARAAFADGRPGDAAPPVEEAVGLWRGAPLADVRETGELSLAARSLEELRFEAEEIQNDVQLALGRHERVLARIERLVEEQPYREKLRAQQILALYRSGRQSEALEAYRQARDAWREELGIEPTPALQELERAVLRHDPSLAAPVLAGAATRRLPAPPTPLIGRRLEIAAVSALLREEARLVTLTGPGGTGKTRLALAVAEELAPGLADGAVFVDLSAVTDPGLVLPTIADAVDAPQGTATTTELAGHLSDRSLLLVLDNLEQVLAGAPRIGELLAAAHRLRVLATSRAALRLAAEHVYPVLPLPLPPAGMTSPEELARSESVRLFTTRARAADPAFELDAATAPDVTEVCRRLDGLPLAIELAAARTRILSPAQLLERLPASLAVLSEGPSDAPARQATLEATIRWSYDLLGEEERRAFERLAVFSNDWPEDAATRCCDVGLDLLARLVDHSLVRQRSRDRTRFFMLETIRQFAADRLAGREGDDTHRRHAEWVLALAEETDRAHSLGIGDFPSALDRLGAELDNTRAALAWSLDHDRDLAFRLAIALRHLWDLRGYLAEGRGWLERTLALADDAPPERRMHLLAALGKLAFHAGDFTESARRHGEMLEIARAIGDDEAVARAVSDIGTAAAATGDYEEAVPYLEEAAERFGALGIGRRRAIALGNLGYIAGEQKDFARAVEATEEALAIQLEEDERSGAAVSLLNLGGFCIEAGDTEGARGWLKRCFALARELGYREVMAYGLLSLMRIALLEDDPQRAAYLAGTAEALLEEIGVGLISAAQAEFAASKERALAALGRDAYDRARAAGAAAGAEEVLAQDELAA